MRILPLLVTASLAACTMGDPDAHWPADQAGVGKDRKIIFTTVAPTGPGTNIDPPAATSVFMVGGVSSIRLNWVGGVTLPAGTRVVGTDDTVATVLGVIDDVASLSGVAPGTTELQVIADDGQLLDRVDVEVAAATRVEFWDCGAFFNYGCDNVEIEHRITTLVLGAFYSNYIGVTAFDASDRTLAATALPFESANPSLLAVMDNTSVGFFEIQGQGIAGRATLQLNGAIKVSLPVELR